MSVKSKRAAALVMACILLFATGVIEVVAELPELDKDCSITVYVGDQMYQKLSELDVVIDIYKVASGVEPTYDTSFTFELLDRYASLDLSRSWDAAAQDAARIALVYGDEPSDIISLNGTFGGLEPGLYLIVTHSNDLEKEISDNGYIVEKDSKLVTQAYDWRRNIHYYFTPELVAVPAYDDNVGWRYECDVLLKPEQEQPSITINKVDAENPDKPLEGAKFALYCSFPYGDSDYDDNFTVYVEGVGEVTMYRITPEGLDADDEGCYTTKKDGSVDIPTPSPAEYEGYGEVNLEHALYALVEIEAPKGYKKLGKPVFFYMEDFYDNSGNIICDSSDRPISYRKIADTNEVPGVGEAGLIVDDNSYYGKECSFVIYPVDDNIPGLELGDKVQIRFRVIADGECHVISSTINEFEENPYDAWTEGNDGYWYYNGEIGWFYDDNGNPYWDAYAYYPFYLVGDYANAIVDWEVAREDRRELNGSAEWDNPLKSYLEHVDYNNMSTVVRYDSMNENGSITIGNYAEEILEIPDTGGIGTSVFGVVIGMMIIGALLLLARRKRIYE